MVSFVCSELVGVVDLVVEVWRFVLFTSVSLRFWCFV